MLFTILIISSTALSGLHHFKAKRFSKKRGITKEYLQPLIAKETQGAKTSAMKIANIINETSFNYQYDCFASIGIIFYRYLGYP
jgi:hypothetical protein